MRTCPVCSREYEPPAQFCQVDGVALRIDAPSVDPYLGTKILEQFRLDRVIGAGGMGVVYEGWNDALSRRVAVKILHRDLVANKDIVTRFHREAQIASQLDHPGIVRVILFGQLADGNLYLVLEFLEGPTLAEALEKAGSFSTERAVRTIGQVADAIGYSHGKGIIHRDLKPENIVLTKRDGEEIPKVLDFGIAKMLVGASSFITQSGLIFGTARYISPEGAAGEKVDQRSDVYSLGVMAYELMAGRAPFESEEPVQLLVKHMHEVPASLRKWGPAMEVPPGVEDVVMRALAKNPDARHEDAAVFAKALRDALAEWKGAPVRSVVPTTAMGMATRDDRPPAQIPTTLAPPEPTAVVTHAPVAAYPTPLANASPQADTHGAMVPTHASNLPRREEFPAVDPRDLPPPTTREWAAEGSFAAPPPATIAMPELLAAQVVPLDDDIQVSGLRSRRVTRPLAADEEITFPRRRSAAWRVFGLIAVAVLVASGVMMAGAWALRMFPEQRQADHVAEMLRRAADAMGAERLTRATNRYSVEDITDDVIVIEPGNVRARQLRRAAAVKLANSATAARNHYHPEQAILLLEGALRLMDDAALRDDLAATRRELQALQARPTVIPVPRPHPGARPVAPAIAPTVAPQTGTAPAAAPAARRPATRRRNATTPATPATEPGVTFTPGRNPDEPVPGPVLQTPFGPVQLNLPLQPSREPDPEPAPADPGTDAPHSGEF